MTYLYKGLGYLMKWCYELFDHLGFGGYALALLLFALAMQIILFPFGIKQQKNSQKQAKLRPKEEVIRKKYAGRTDKTTQLKMNEEIQKLYQEENFSPLAGCLPLLIQFPILIALFYVIKAPLTYVSGMGETLILSLNDFFANTLPELGIKAANGIKYVDEISLVREIIANKEAVFAQFPEVANYTLPDFTLFNGFIDLSMKPIAAFSDGNFASLWQLMIIPVVTTLAAYFQQKLSKKFMYQPQTTESASSLKLMEVTMPLFSGYLACIWPGAMGVYWTFRSILAFVQQWLLSLMYPIPKMTDEELKAAMKAYNEKNKSKPYKAEENKNRKSLIFDDDEEGYELPELNESIVSEKANPDDSVIDKAPLKDDEE